MITRLLALALLLLAGLCSFSADAATATGRTAIKINTDKPTPNSPGGGGAGAGGGSNGTPPPPTRGRGGGAHIQPVLFRQPNAVLPPPFLQQEHEDEPASNLVDATNALGLGTHNETTTAAAAHAPAAVVLDAFGYPVPSASDSEDGEGWSSDVSAWTNGLAGRCWSYSTSAYIYSFCPFQNVTQRSTTTTLHVVMGVWDSWIESETTTPATPTATADAATSEVAAAAASEAVPLTEYHILQSFTDGTACGSGKRRSTKVLFICEASVVPSSPNSGSEAPASPAQALQEDDEFAGSRVSDVHEPATCEYTILFHTPLVCDRATLAAAKVSASTTTPTATALAEQESTIRAMQTCIDLLFQSAQPQSRTAEVEAACRDFLPPPSLAGSDAAAAAPAATPAARVLSSIDTEGDFSLEASSTPYEAQEPNAHSRE